jgi:hypothetical protein
MGKVLMARQQVFSFSTSNIGTELMDAAGCLGQKA